MKDCDKCSHKPVCDLWRRKECQDAKSFSSTEEECDFFAEKQRWIPVTERLPQNYISVLVYLPGERPLPTVHEAYIGGDGEWHSSVVYGVENEDVTHWMPIPDPPKEGS